MGLIELHQVAKTIKRRQLLHHVEASIERGSITTLEGINGSGKTLILKALLGLITVTGQVVVAGKTVSPQEAYPIKAGILIENPSLIDDFTAMKNLELLARLDPTIQPQQLDDLLTYFELTRFPTQKVRKFSLGMKQSWGLPKRS
ncbi:ATP-binding cassette domain-containing protein [Lactobacillus rhamnosus]|nr:ATP-binding cassette domain-containing protein [Lacticaseibacillus rhamnosus]